MSRPASRATAAGALALVVATVVGLGCRSDGLDRGRYFSRAMPFRIEAGRTVVLPPAGPEALDEREALVFALADGQRTVDQVVAALDAMAEAGGDRGFRDEVEGLLARLVERGFVTVHGAPEVLGDELRLARSVTAAPAPAPAAVDEEGDAARPER